MQMTRFFFCPPNLDYLLNIKKTLILFNLASGLQVNFHKSSLMGIHTDDSWLQKAAECLLCKVGSLPFTYLGLPIGGCTSRLSTWDPIIDRMNKKLALWKGKLLSLGGRLTLIKASLSSLPLYFMSLFPIPKGILEKINKIQRQFLWSGGSEKSLALAPWALIERPKAQGGLGVGNLLHRNFGLLFKWIWRFFKEPNTLWRRVIQDKYGYPASFNLLDLQPIAKGGPWKAICNSIMSFPEAKTFLNSRIKTCVGNGKQAQFWHDVWLCANPLKSIFPRLFRIASNPLATIESLGRWEDQKWIWDLSWSRFLRPRDFEEVETLNGMLQNVILSVDTKDSLIWMPHKSGLFSVKSICSELDKSLNSEESPAIKGLWRGLVPPRIEIFMWLALLGRINTKSKLAGIGIIPQEDSLCVLCQAELETHNHLLLHCEFSQKIWSWWLQTWNLSWVFPLNLRDAFTQWNIKDKGKFFKKIWVAIFFIITWSIWKERNARLFNKISLSFPQIQDLILTRLGWWIRGWGDPFPYSCTEILRNPSCLEWSEINASKGVAVQSPCLQSWSLPPINHVKWNVDASVLPLPHMSAIGGVLRDHHGIFKCMFSSPVPPLEINCAEVLAINRAIQISMADSRLKCMPILIESDSSNAVKWCNEDCGGPWNLNYQLNFIRNARKLWLNISISHKGRGANMVADSLAKQGLVRNAEFLAWM